MKFRRACEEARALTLLGTLSLLLVASPAPAVDLPGKTSARLGWTAASGPVAGYRVYVERNGVPASTHEQVVSSPSATVMAAAGDSLLVSVRAVDSAGNPGPSSMDSDALRFLPAAGAPATASVSPASLAVSTPQGKSPASVAFTVRNTGSGTLSWKIASSAAWVAPGVTTGTTTSETDTVTLTFSTTTLTQGSYTAQVSVTNTTTQAVTSLPVTLTVAAPGPALSVDATGLAVTAFAGQSPAGLSITVRNAGSGTISYTASDSASWLTITPATGTSTGESDLLSVAFNTTSLAPGAYTATIAVAAPGATPSLRQIPVTLSVVMAPALQASIEYVTVHASHLHAPPDQQFTLRNAAGGTRSYTIQSDAPWLVVSPSSGTSSGENDPITLHFDTGDEPPGEHVATLRVASPGTLDFAIPVTLRIRPPAGDVDGDGTSEAFLWKRSTGALLAFGNLFSGATTSGMLPAGRPADWQLLLSGDHDGDGATDLFWRHRASGGVMVCLTNGLAVASCGSPFSLPATYVLLGAGDLNADGRADVIFRDPATGRVFGCFLNGVSTAYCTDVGSFPTSWRVLAGGDHDGDGYSEIVVQDPVSPRLQICSIAGPRIGTCTTPIALLGAEPISTGDYDGDGRADLLWLQRSTWRLLVEFVSPSGWVSFRTLGTAPANAEIVGTGDLDGDGTSDLQLRDPATGAMSVWFVGATGLLEQVSLGSLGVDFTLGGGAPTP